MDRIALIVFTCAQAECWLHVSFRAYDSEACLRLDEDQSMANPIVQIAGYCGQSGRSRSGLPAPLGFEIGGAYLFSANNQVYRDLSTANYTVRRRREKLGNQHSDVVIFRRLATYQITSSLSGILGFRYDSFVTKFSEP